MFKEKYRSFRYHLHNNHQGPNFITIYFMLFTSPGWFMEYLQLRNFAFWNSRPAAP